MPKPSPALSRFISEAQEGKIHSCAIAVLTQDGNIGWLIQTTPDSIIPILEVLPLLERDLLKAYHTSNQDTEITLHQTSNRDPNLN